MSKLNIQAASYYVCGLEGYTLSEALRHWKARFETIKHFHRDVITHPALAELGTFVADVWERIDPVTVTEALQEANMEKRRVMFDCIGVARLFKALEPEQLNRQVVSKTRMRWDQNNEPYEYQFEDTYELYRIAGEKLFEQERSFRIPGPVYAVRCWCTTTAREYWIYVPEEAALGERHWTREEPDADAIRAIAWTIWIDITHPKRIFRQGDIIVVEESEDSTDVEPYPLSKEQYLQLLYSET